MDKMLDIKKWWKSLRLTIKSTLIMATVSIALGIPSCVNSCRAINLTKKEFLAKYTPDLRAHIRSSNIYVGEGSKFGRIDNVISIPLVIVNKSYGLAKNITVSVLYNDSAGVDKEFILTIPVLKGGDPMVLPEALQSILAGAHEIYSSKQRTFKMKIFLSWEGVNKKKYESVELFKLNITESYSDYPSNFIFVSQGFYNSTDNTKELKKYSSHKIDF